MLNILFVGPSALIVGALVGIFAYRYVLVKNPTLINTLVGKAKADIESIASLLDKKKSVLPVAAVPVTPAVVVATVKVDPIVVAAVNPVTTMAPIVAPVTAAPVAAPVAVVAEVAPVVAAPVATA